MNKRIKICMIWMGMLVCSMMGFALVTQQTALAVTVVPEKPAPVDTSDANTTEAATTKPTSMVVSKPSVRVTGRTTSSVKLEWKKVKNAKKYYVYRKDSKKGKYKKIATTKRLKYKNSKLKSKKTYYYRVVASATAADGKEVLSKNSKTKKAKTKPVIKKTAYVGDSVMSGMSSYGGAKGKGRKVIAKIGVSTWNFWRGTIMDDLLNYNADRIYIMLGMNSLGGNPSSAQLDVIISNYKKIIDDCKKKNKDVEIIVLAVSPTTPSATVKNSAILAYNKKLKQMAKKKKVYYYDYTAAFKDGSGCLKSEFNGGDGIHWTVATYQMFKKKLDAYGKKLDKN